MSDITPVYTSAGSISPRRSFFSTGKELLCTNASMVPEATMLLMTPCWMRSMIMSGLSSATSSTPCAISGSRMFRSVITLIRSPRSSTAVATPDSTMRTEVSPPSRSISAGTPCCTSFMTMSTSMRPRAAGLVTALMMEGPSSVSALLSRSTSAHCISSGRDDSGIGRGATLTTLATPSYSSFTLSMRHSLRHSLCTPTSTSACDAGVRGCFCGVGTIPCRRLEFWGSEMSEMQESMRAAPISFQTPASSMRCTVTTGRAQGWIACRSGATLSLHPEGDSSIFTFAITILEMESREGKFLKVEYMCWRLRAYMLRTRMPWMRSDRRFIGDPCRCFSFQVFSRVTSIGRLLTLSRTFSMRTLPTSTPYIITPPAVYTTIFSIVHSFAPHANATAISMESCIVSEDVSAVHCMVWFIVFLTNPPNWFVRWSASSTLSSLRTSLAICVASLMIGGKFSSVSSVSFSFSSCPGHLIALSSSCLGVSSATMAA
mmetsp:Transcript_10731/g.22334  ORF Transcript_10731/g.22334 Transcript_10731/m.22334 type:complete len:488 (+) Transcript_10731:271-1734(+)